MHEYTLFQHDRKNTYYVVATVGATAGGLIAKLLTVLNTTSGVLLGAPSGLLVFGIVFLLFDRFIWKWEPLYTLGLVKVPNLNGKWEADMKSSRSDAETITAKITVHQTYTKIRIRLETKKSFSLSQMAAIEMADPTCFFLRYEYLAEFTPEEHAEVIRHFGVTRIELKSDNVSFNNEQFARYYTELGRDTHGTISLKKMVAGDA